MRPLSAPTARLVVGRAYVFVFGGLLSCHFRAGVIVFCDAPCTFVRRHWKQSMILRTEKNARWGCGLALGGRHGNQDLICSAKIL